MFCDKCGKDNVKGAEVCKYCGAKMPSKSACGGFGDILSFENVSAGAPESATASAAKSAASDMEIKRLSERVSSLTARSKKMAQTCMIVGAASAVLAIAALGFASSTSGKLKAAEQKIDSIEKKITVLETEGKGIADSIREWIGEKKEMSKAEIKELWDVKEYLEKIKDAEELDAEELNAEPKGGEDAPPDGAND